MELREINITEKKIKQFQSKGIETVEDLLRFFPKSYYDFRTPQSLDTAEMEETGVFIGVVSRIKKGRGVVYCDVFEKLSQTSFRVLWFNKPFMYNALQEYMGEKVVVGGCLTYDTEYSLYQIANPFVFTNKEKEGLGVYPVYPAIKGMSADYLQASIKAALSVADRTDKYDEGILKDFQLIGQYELYYCIHRPKAPEDVKKAKQRLIFEELYDFAYRTELAYVKSSVTSPYQIRTTKVMEGFINRLSYQLTKDQQQALRDLLAVAMTGNRINALVQGDVGCGKTIIAICLMVAMAENGFQSVLLAPTSVLAEQHYLELSQYSEQLGYHVAFLVGGLKAAERKKVLKRIKEGACQFVVCTHSVLSEEVEFNKLGMAVIDEEHRFGVSQREYLSRDNSIHTVTMSATPIPRSLGLTMYGKDKKIYTIQTMPNGRKKVKTQIYHNDKMEFEFLKRQINEGRQAYIVCAMKEEKQENRGGENSVNVESVEEIKTMADLYLSPYGIKSEILTGSTGKEEKNEILARFMANETQVLIATTVVEVGVNVPNASVIVIRNAERFGLATLHQLRGRVGRGSYQSYCILDSIDFANPRLKVIEETTDGFVVARKDLEQRGSGEFIGTKQSGENKCAMLMLSYPKYYQSIERYVERRVKWELNMV